MKDTIIECKKCEHKFDLTKIGTFTRIDSNQFNLGTLTCPEQEFCLCPNCGEEHIIRSYTPTRTEWANSLKEF